MTSKKMATAIIAVALVLGKAATAAETHAPRFAVIDWFPFGYEVQGGIQKGIFIDVTRALSKALNVESEIIVASAPRVYRGIRVGEFDFTYSYHDTAEKEGFEPLIDIGCLRPTIVSFKRFPIKSVDQLHGKTIAFPLVGYFVRNLLPNYRIRGFAVPRTEMMFKMALRGRIDGFIINDAIWQAYKNNMHPEFNIPKARWAEFEEPLYIERLPVSLSVSYNSNHMPLARAIKDIVHNKAFLLELAQIYDKYSEGSSLGCFSERASSVSSTLKPGHAPLD